MFQHFNGTFGWKGFIKRDLGGGYFGLREKILGKQGVWLGEVSPRILRGFFGKFGENKAFLDFGSPRLKVLGVSELRWRSFGEHPKRVAI